MLLSLYPENLPKVRQRPISLCTSAGKQRRRNNYLGKGTVDYGWGRKGVGGLSVKHFTFPEYASVIPVRSREISLTKRLAQFHIELFVERLLILFLA